ncbi:lipase 3-like [Teleopsis dalmanni]|uniref:lipase 3-like n=1 Tax=Teleopsis dalmanni TaxID=139649 RepID=UPI000D329430|nr:lipase 3-like [Teleopsis dalmanni]XP_037952478.1 lipase 3-like [Teleopsis dalmanni]
MKTLLYGVGVLTFLLAAGYVSAGERPISDCGERIENDGYPMEEHTVTTDDSYILTMHRIPYSKKTGPTGDRPVVFLMHGMLSSSSDWVLMGPGKALAYILSDAGYDVWMGNARGNTYSKKHKYWPTYWQIFWNFSWHEIGIYDVPNMIDYILKYTKKSQLQYVGHSQGTTVYLVMMSERPEYNNKIKSAHLLGPAAYMGNMKSPLTRAFAPILGQPNAMVELCGSMEFMPSNQFKQDMGIATCQATSPYAEMCANEIFLIGGYDSEQLDRDLLEHIKATSPAGASVNQNLHFCQEHNSKKFRKFDYSVIRNPYEYGTMYPPNYKIKNALAPVMLYYGANDWMCDLKDVLQLRDELPNVHLDYLVEFPKWAHLDFIWGTEAKKYVYDKVLEMMIDYE